MVVVEVFDRGGIDSRRSDLAVRRDFEKPSVTIIDQPFPVRRPVWSLNQIGGLANNLDITSVTR